MSVGPIDTSSAPRASTPRTRTPTTRDQTSRSKSGASPDLVDSSRGSRSTPWLDHAGDIACLWRQPLTDAQAADLLEVIEDRAGRRSTIDTSQLPIAHWHEGLGEASHVSIYGACPYRDVLAGFDALTRSRLVPSPIPTRRQASATRTTEMNGSVKDRWSPMRDTRSNHPPIAARMTPIPCTLHRSTAEDSVALPSTFLRSRRRLLATPCKADVSTSCTAVVIAATIRRPPRFGASTPIRMPRGHEIGTSSSLRI